MRTPVQSLFERNARTPMFVPSLLVAALFAVVFGAAPAFATSYFNQTFQANTTLGTYVGTGANQFDDIGSSGTTPTVVNSGGSNVLRMTRSNAKETWFTRGAAVATDLSPAPTAMIFKFDFNLTSITSSGTTPATLRIGSGFTTGNLEPSDANTYAKLGIVNNTGTGFQIRDITNNASPLATNYTTRQSLTWVMNNTAGTLTYQAPDSSSETIAVDKADLWVGTTKVLNDVSVQTGTQTMTDFKFYVGSNNANYEFDNFDIQTLSPTLSLSQTAATCIGNDGTITATFANGTGPYQTKLDGGAFAAHTSPFQYTGLAPGTHLVTVQDNVGTQTFKTIVVGTPIAISLSLSQVATSCNAGTDGKILATWSTGTAPFQINIDGGSFAAATSPFTLLNLAAGSHTVNLTDVNTCSATQSLSVTQPTALALTTITGNPCSGTTNGVITATFSGGTGAYQTQINGGGYSSATSPKSFTGLAAGNYIIDLKDANGCTKSTSTITLVQNAALSLALDSQIDLLCNGAATGSITVSFSGGTGTLTSSVDDASTFTSGASPRTFSGLAAGTHIIRLKDSNPNSPCRDSISVTLTQPATAVSLTLTKTDLTCNGVSTGTATATFSGGTGALKIGLDGATPVAQASPFTYAGLTAATHTVVLVDANGCTTSKTATPAQPSAIALSLSQVPVSCATAADGAIIATFSGGTGAFQTDIDGGGFTSAISPRILGGLASGSHTVTVKDANGCATNQSITVGGPGSLNLSLTASDVTCTAGSNGTVTATFSGGTPLPNTIFTQDFQANTTLSTYTTGAANMFNDATGANNGVASITTSGSNNALRLTRINGGQVWWTRTTDFSPTPSAVVYKFNYTVSGITGTLGSLPNTLRIGTGFATGATEPSDANTYAKVGFLVDNLTGFKIEDITNGTTLPTVHTGTQAITWALNNSNADYSYLGPDNASHGLANDRMDVWVGATRVLSGVTVQTPSSSMTDMRYFGTSNMGQANFDFDNFVITAPTGDLETKIDAGVFSTVLSARVFAGLAAGSHTVTLRDGAGCTTSQAINVNENPALFTIAASAGANGQIAPSGNVSVACGTSRAFTIAPSACYQVANVIVDGVSVGAATSYTFTNVTANHTISAAFVISTGTITASAGAGGAINPAGAVIVNCNTDQAFTITLDSCHTLTDVLVDGSSMGAVSSYTFTSVTGPHTIAASFAIIPYTITASAGGNGVISPGGAVAVNCGASQVFTFTPDSCYQVADVRVDGVSVGAPVNYTFTSVAANHTIDVSFLSGNGTITASAGAHGAITPAGALTVNCHGDQSYSIAPDSCYHVADVVVDGASVGALTSYAFLSVTANHTIAATFATDTYTIAASAGANGSISPNGSVVTNCGTDQAFTITPANGYHVADVLVDGATVGAVASYTFTNVLVTHSISATFAIYVYTLAVATPDSFGTVTLNPAGGTYNHGTSVQLTAVPTAGYHFVTWNATAGGDTTTATNPLTIIMTRNRSLTATFAINTYKLTVTQTANGSIAPKGPIMVNSGATQAFTITPNANYHIVAVTVDGVVQGAITSYTLTNITANHTITATYAITTYAITASAGGNGAISPTGTVTVNPGANQAFTITPSTGYHVLDVMVDAVSVGAVSSYTFTNVQSVHTIAASFAINTYTLATTTVGSGTITATPNQATYNHFTAVTLTATPSAGFAFLGWTGDTSVTTNPVSIVMSSNRNLVANFVPGTLLLYQDFHFSNTLTDYTIGGTNTGTQPDGRWDSFAFSGSGTTAAITSNALLYTRATGGVESFSRTTDFAGAPAAMIYRFNLQKTASTGAATPAAVLRVGGGFTTSIAADEADTSTFGKIGINIGNTNTTTYEIRNISAASPVNVPVAGDSIITWVLNKSGAALSYLAPNGTTASLGNNLMDIWVGRSLPAAFAGVPATTTGAAMTDLKFYWNTNPATLKFDNFNIIAPTLAATITASAGAGGAISPNGATVVQTGNNQSYTITPNACFHIADVLVDGASVGAVSSYAFTNVFTGHTIAASFAADIKTITASGGANGTISPNGAVAVNCGANQTFTITPDSCHTVGDVLVDGASFGALTTYTFSNVQVAHTIAVSFVAGTPTVTASAGANGSISPTGALSVSCGADQAFTITPNACYHVASVLVDGVSVGALTSYIFTNVAANHTISASFTSTNYTIVASATGTGTISPSGNIVVNCNAAQSFTMSTDACNQLDSLLVDGVSVSPVTTYTFSNVAANHTISASFTSTNYTIVASATGTGTISPSGNIVVNCNAAQSFTMSTDACNQLDSLLVDGVSVSPVTSYTFNTVAANHTITAKFKGLQKSISVTQVTGGTIAPTTSATAMLVNCGTNQTFTITPDTCYRLTDVLADGLFQGPVTSYTFTNVTTNTHTITAQYTAKTYTIDTNWIGPGTITPNSSGSNSSMTLNCGVTQTFNFNASTCNSISSVRIDGNVVPMTTSYTFTNVQANHTISVIFQTGGLTIAASVGAGGSLTPAGSTAVNCHDNLSYTITPDPCFAIANVLVDGVSVGAVGGYTFTDIQAGHTISGTFAATNYTVTASAGANGAIAPMGAQPVACGANLTFTITPSACFQVANVLVDGVSVGAVTSYAFTNVAANHTITASFVGATYTIAASVTGGGSITPSGNAVVNCAANQTFTIAPAANHHAVDVLVDGVSVGTVTSYTFTNVVAAHTIAATFAADTYAITATAGAHGTIAPAGVTNLNLGDGQSYAITADAHYHVADVLADGVSVGAVTNYGFTNVSTNHTIAASFALNTYTVTASAGSNGVISPSGGVSVDDGNSQSFTVGPNSCYHIADVLVDGVSVGAVGTYSFTNVVANHAIAASFAVDTYTLTASAGANGSITPSGATVANCGGSQGYTITPNACYHVADVLVDGVSMGALASYSFSNVTANHAIAANFAVGTQTIAASAGTGGAISPSGSVAVNCGSDQTFTITPDACYHINGVMVDGLFQGPVTSYSFTNVTTNTHAIAATFTFNNFTIAASAGVNGSITPNGSVSVGCGGTQAFTIAPDTCYQIANVLVDGNSVGAVTTYTFANVLANHVISATFVSGSPAITATAGDHGSIAPVGNLPLSCGASQTFTITPDACYRVEEVMVDGGSVGALTSYTFMNVLANHTIAATFALTTKTVTASAGTGGIISPSGSVAVPCGTGQSFSILPAACYHVADVLVDGVSVGAVTNYNFNSVTTDRTIAASFAVNVETVTASAGANGSITPLGAVPVNCGSDQSFTIQPNSCYHIADVLVDGNSVGAVPSYSFTNVTTNHTIAASFAVDVETVTASATAHGSITPSGAVAVNCGNNQTFTITPAVCYQVAEVLIDGASVGAVTSYMLTNVTAGHTIAASFVQSSLTVTASAGAHGTITPSGAIAVSCGSDQSLGITADACYHIADVLVDGNSVGAVASYALTNVTGDHTIAASFAVNVETVTVSAGANGSITPTSAVSVNCGNDQLFTITANSCYHIADVLVDGSSVGAVGSHTITNVTADHTIAASFAVNVETVTASAGPNGSITPSGAIAVNCGSDQPFTITPAACYHIADVLVDGNSVGAVASYALTNVTGDHTIAASFAINVQTVTASAGANGSITPAGAVAVNCGSDQSFTIQPNSCYHIADVLVDGNSVGAVPSYSFTNVTTNHTIVASFAVDVETVTASAGAHGSISPTGGVLVNCGGAQGFSVAPAACYHIGDVLVDGASVGAVANYNFATVGANHTIAASFTVDAHVITASTGPHGSISQPGALAIDCGTSRNYTITPAPCSHNVDVLVDGVSVGAVASYSFTNVTTDHTIDASFDVDIETITASAGPNGSITPSGGVGVTCGTDQAFTIAANSCYHIADVLVDGSSVGAVTSYAFNNVLAVHTIAASFATDTYTITAAAAVNGSVTPAGASVVNCGTSPVYTMTPAGGYHVVDLLVDGSSVGALASYTFTAVAANHTIAASFAVDAYTITASADPNGSISPSGAVAVTNGGSQSFTITPNAHYHVLDVLVDGVSVGAVTTRNFTNVTANHTIAASFAVDTRTITASAGANGSITPLGSTAVSYGGSQSFSISPAANYHVLDVLVDGVSVGSVTNYPFINVTTNHTIAASFAINTYTIAASAGSNGSITPPGTVTVNYGGGQAFTMTPAVNNHIADVLVDGVSVGAVAGYTFSNVTTNHTIAASFALTTYTIVASAGAYGAISPAGTVGVTGGTSQGFSILPAACYSVADVLVDGVSVGAMSNYNFANVTANHTILATFGIKNWTITGSAGANGTVSPLGASAVICGGTQAYTVTPAAHFHVASVLVDGESAGPVTSYTFTNVTAPHTISATFAVDQLTITATAGANGAISPSGSVLVNYGWNRPFTIVPAANYHVATLTVDGAAVPPATSYTFLAVTTNHTIAATFALNTQTIVATAGPNGVISPSGSVLVNYGWNRPFTIVPAANYHVATLTVDGVAVAPATSYTFTNVTTNHTIVATFAINGFTITASAGPNGTISPVGTVVVASGGSRAFTLTPAANAHVATLTVDGAAVAPATSYSFTNVTANHTIAATFALNQLTITATAGANGVISPGGAVLVNYGWNRPFTIVPAADYHVATLTADGAAVTPATSYTFTKVTTNHTIAVTFAHNGQKINASAGTNGTISPAGVVEVDSAGAQVFTVAPVAGYHIVTLMVDGAPVTPSSGYTFSNVTANHTILVTFGQVLAVETVPTELALAGLRPNPAVGPLNVSFSLPNSEPAKLELIDVGGRVVRSKEVGSMGAGRHLVNLGQNRDLAAGVYWLRLSQGDHAVTSKATVVH